MLRSLSASILAVAFLLAISAAAQENTWQIDPNHSAAQFSVRHLGISTVRGAFTKVSGTVVYDPGNPSKASLQATIDAASLDTRVEARDKDVKSANYLDVETFKSKKVEAAGAGKLRITGDLTIHGVTKEVVLDVEGPSAAVKDPWGNQRMGASATTTVNRMDYGVAGGKGMVGDDLSITLDIEMTHK